MYHASDENAPPLVHHLGGIVTCGCDHFLRPLIPCLSIHITCCTGSSRRLTFSLNGTAIITDTLGTSMLWEQMKIDGWNYTPPLKYITHVLHSGLINKWPIAVHERSPPIHNASVSGRISYSPTVQSTDWKWISEHVAGELSWFWVMLQ